MGTDTEALAGYPFTRMRRMRRDDFSRRLMRETTLSPSAYAEYLRARRIDALFVTTALFNQVAREVPDAFAPLGAVLFGGEAVDPRAVARVLEAGAPRRLLHVYGPTEGTTFSSWYEVEAVAPDAETVPIGYPVANTTLHVLDESRQPVPVGETGELYVGGDGLANRSERSPDRSPHSTRIRRRWSRQGKLSSA